ncbi:response regulator transcription factor [Marinobacter nauticus]|uniref:response regulator transcription factor n=1 Tax=Marinobacter nauticus TaxID=2743 RepID=UPI001D194531|nr:response regulator transcription factor [Marinobacter nauticus]MCC4271801.1 response regulator transcription factor [Marinobacter nauticus]
MTITVLTIEDHELYRDGLRLLVQEAIPGAVVIEASDFPSARSALKNHPEIALVLLDIHVPGTRGLNGLEQIKSGFVALPVVVISSVDQPASIQQMLRLGADGFIAKSSQKPVMIQALKDVMAGETVTISGQDSDELPALSPRQIATLELMAMGLANKQIAIQLTISPTTVRDYVSEILALFNCDNRTQAVLKARRLGYILD